MVTFLDTTNWKGFSFFSFLLFFLSLLFSHQLKRVGKRRETDRQKVVVTSLLSLSTFFSYQLLSHPLLITLILISKTTFFSVPFSSLTNYFPLITIINFFFLPPCISFFLLVFLSSRQERKENQTRKECVISIHTREWIN